MDPVLKTAAELYREFNRRGLHIRHEDGRDRSLFDALRAATRCPDEQLQRHLDATAMTAEAFLLIFLEITEPFSMMYEDIWRFLASSLSTSARESVAVQFGQGSATGTRVNLEQFRRHVEQVRRVWTRARTPEWPLDRLNDLFALNDLLRPSARVRTFDEQPVQIDSYLSGQHLRLRELSAAAPPLLRRVHRLLQDAINAVAAPGMDQQDLFAARYNNTLAQPDQRLIGGVSQLLTDLVPLWSSTFGGAQHLTHEALAAGEEFYDARVIEPPTSVGIWTDERVRQALDILDLPFWRERWRTYEIWATVATLRAMRHYRVRPVVSVDGLVLTLPIGAVIATFQDDVDAEHCLAAQLQTNHGGQSIRPDLRICRGSTASAPATVAVIEFKQRMQLTPAHVLEVCTKYVDGSPNARGVLLLNYDHDPIVCTLPPKATLLQNVRPDQPELCKAFKEWVLSTLRDVGLFGGRRLFVVLIDLSSSMDNRYAGTGVEAAFMAPSLIPGLHVLGFHSEDVQPINLALAMAGALTTSGTTDLDCAMKKIHERVGVPDVLLLVSDGDHGGSPLAANSAHHHEILPGEFADGLSWLSEAIMKSRQEYNGSQ